jgi:hypothetical protein|tara:strand:- start:3487 stop:4953 length:1467 start_codon:yes stop_codon:yes gene_type:complete
MKKLNCSPQGEATRFWHAFGIEAIFDEESGALVGSIPAGVVAFHAYGSEQIEAQRRKLQAIGIPPTIWADVGPSERLALYQLDEDISLEEIREDFDSASRVCGEGDYVTLPSGDYFTQDTWPETIGDLSDFDTLDEDPGPADESPCDDLPQQISAGTLLDKFSVRDADLGDPVFSRFLLGRFVLSGQATVIYAPPNSGKTLLTLHLLDEAVLASNLSPARCYYVNADDSPEGVHTKRSILADTGLHMLVPGLQSFEAAKLLEAMDQIIVEDDCEGVFVIVDTLKKFVDLMDKKQAASFGDLVRKFVLKGGTFLALAHTRKNEGADGQLVYGGTSDIVEDFDAACLLVPLPDRTSRGEKTVQFQFRKRRGRNVEEVYAFDDDPDLTYDVRLASVRRIYEEELIERVASQQHRSDAELISAIEAAIKGGEVQKMALVRAVSKKTAASRASVMAVLERYTGEDPGNHLWDFTVQARGAKVFHLHVEPEPDG